MTEAEWLACEAPLAMLDFLRGKASARKLRLFACANCRRHWSWFDDDPVARHAVEVVEKFADGQASEDELRQAEVEVTNRSGSLVLEATGPDSEIEPGVWLVARHIADAIGYTVPDEEVEGATRAEERLQAMVARDIFGNPYRPVAAAPSWLTSTVLAFASQMYESRDFGAMPILADALQDAGCDSADVLDHCRGPGPHVRGCWVVDLLTGRE